MSERQRNGWAGEAFVRQVLRRSGGMVLDGAYAAPWDLLRLGSRGGACFYEVKARKDTRTPHLSDAELAFRDQVNQEGHAWHLVTVRIDRRKAIRVESCVPSCVWIQAGLQAVAEGQSVL